MFHDRLTKRANRWAIRVSLLAAAAFSLAAAGEAAPFGPFAASLDFDHGQKAGLATAEGSYRDRSGYTFELLIRLGADAQAITVRTARAATRMFARDLDGDADRDLVVEAFDREPIAVLLNDGGGHFHQAPLEDYRPLLRPSAPHSADSGARSDDSPETGECPPAPADADALETSAPALPVSRGPASSGPCVAVLRHPVFSTRGPPATL